MKTTPKVGNSSSPRHRLVWLASSAIQPSGVSRARIPENGIPSCLCPVNSKADGRGIQLKRSKGNRPSQGEPFIERRNEAPDRTSV